MELGIQTYSIRHFLSRDSSHALNATKGARFLEIAGAADSTLVDFAAAHLEQRNQPFGPGPSPVLGAHVSSINILDPSEEEGLINMHMRAFDTLKWVVFFLNPNDIEEIEGSVKNRTEIYKKYAQRLNGYKRYISRAYPRRNVQVLYHTYPHDFLVTTEGTSCIEHMLQHIDQKPQKERLIQLDVYFSAMAGVCALEVTKAIGRSVHSVHFNSWNRDGKQADLERGSVGRDLWKLFMQTCARQEIQYGIIEHDIDPGSAHHVMKSLDYLNSL